MGSGNGRPAAGQVTGTLEHHTTRSPNRTFDERLLIHTLPSPHIDEHTIGLHGSNGRCPHHLHAEQCACSMFTVCLRPEQLHARRLVHARMEFTVTQADTGLHRMSHCMRLWKGYGPMPDAGSSVTVMYDQLDQVSLYQYESYFDQALPCQWQGCEGWP